MERKLASIQKINKLEPIIVKETGLEADSICLAQVLGWSVVVKKSEFQEGDLCVFFEIDSIVPENPEYEFLRSKHFHIKTLKLGSMRYKYVDAPVISQGLALPLNVALDGYADDFVVEGDDVTEITGVTKYEKPEPAVMSKGIKHWNFHPLVPKTDELRIQSYPELLNKIMREPYYITQKLDGSSTTVIYDTEMHVYSRNLEVSSESLYWQTAEKSHIIELAYANPGFAFQGELVGPNVQNNRMGLHQHELKLFNMYDTNLRKYTDFDVFLSICEYFTVPIIEVGHVFFYTLDELVLLSQETYPNGFPQEGIVVRMQKETEMRGFSRVSFKVINPNFLLKIGE